MQNMSITVSSVSSRAAEEAAAELAAILARSDLRPRQAASSSTAQDAGVIVQIVLGSASVIALAKGLEAWMGRWQAASLTVEVNGKKMKLERVTGKHLIEALELFLK